MEMKKSDYDTLCRKPKTSELIQGSARLKRINTEKLFDDLDEIVEDVKAFKKVRCGKSPIRKETTESLWNRILACLCLD